MYVIIYKIKILNHIFCFDLDFTFSYKEKITRHVRVQFRNKLEIIYLYNSHNFSSKKLVPLVVLQCLRVLLRDPEYLLIFVQENGLNGLKKV